MDEPYEKKTFSAETLLGYEPDPRRNFSNEDALKIQEDEKRLKQQTRGSRMDGNSYKRWVEALQVEKEIRQRLLGLSPESYIGLAIQITDQVITNYTIRNS